MRGFLIDVVKGTAQVVECENDLHAWYKLLNCDIVEMPERQIKGKYYTFICDEEGLLKNNPIVSAINENMEPMLYGNLLIFNIDSENCDIADLTDEDIEVIKSNIYTMIDTKLHQILANVEY